MTGAVSRRLALFVSVVIVVDTGLAIAGEHPWSGPTVYGVGDSHGLHLADLVMIAAAAVALAWLWRSAKPRR